MKLKLSQWLLILCCLCSLFGCSYNPFIGNNHTTGNPAGAILGTTIGAGSVALLNGPKPVIALAGIGGGMLGYYVTTLRYDAGGIVQAGGQVYKIGDYVGIEVPTDQLFEVNTSDFLPQAGPVLQSIATVLMRYPNNNIIISGNTSGFARPRWELRLSEYRAQKIAAYLWDAGITPFKDNSIEIRKLTYVGYGNFFPIQNNYTNGGIRTNSRIQITSYPSICELQMSQRERALFNVGETDDSTIVHSPNCL